MQLEHNSLTNLNFVKTLNNVYSADYAYEKVCILRKALSKLDQENRLLFGGIVSQLESFSIDEQDEFWNGFKQKVLFGFPLITCMRQLSIFAPSCRPGAISE